MTTSAKFTVKDPIYTHQFSQPFTAMKEEVDELPIRKPNGLDMLEIGTPVAYDSNTGRSELDIPKCYAMTSRLSNMPEKILLTIDAGEMHDFFWLLASFFLNGRQALLPALERQKAELSTAPGSPGHSHDGSTQEHL